MKKNKKIFFSVIIPTYNMADYLVHSVKSVLKQNYKNFEIIIVDNYSNDKTKKIIKNLKNSKIKFFQINNKGVIGKSRNLGIKKSKGNWIAFLDADDYWFSNKLKIIKKEIEKYNFDYISNSEVVKSTNTKTKKIWHYGSSRKNCYENFLRYGSVFSTSASVIKRNFLINNKIWFSEKKVFSSFEDYDFFLNIAFKGGSFYFLKDVLGKHLFHEQSTTLKKKNYDQSLQSVIKSHVKKQKFEPNKNKLLSDILMFHEIKNNLFNLFNFKKICISLTKLFVYFISRPIDFLKIIYYLINRQLYFIERIN